MDSLADLDPDVQRLVCRSVQLPECLVDRVVTRRNSGGPVLGVGHVLAGLARVVTEDRRGAVTFVDFLTADWVFLTGRADCACLTGFVDRAFLTGLADWAFLTGAVDCAFRATLADLAAGLGAVLERVGALGAEVGGAEVDDAEVDDAEVDEPEVEDDRAADAGVARSLATSARSRAASACTSSNRCTDTSPRRVIAISTSLRTRARRSERLAAAAVKSSSASAPA